jgi:hypothetical protein
MEAICKLQQALVPLMITMVRKMQYRTLTLRYNIMDNRADMPLQLMLQQHIHHHHQAIPISHRSHRNMIIAIYLVISMAIPQAAPRITLRLRIHNSHQATLNMTAMTPLNNHISRDTIHLRSKTNTNISLIAAIL